MAKVTCPYCKVVYKGLDSSFANTKVECSNCGGQFIAILQPESAVTPIKPSTVPVQNQTPEPPSSTPPPPLSMPAGRTHYENDGNNIVNHSSSVITCPHCWRHIDFQEINYISRHMDLLGDPVLGEEAQRRFLPEKFSAKGLAIDAYGMECPEMACPVCHLKIPNALFELPTSFFSIVGMPSSGKSYFLTVMLWQIRKSLSNYFEFNLNDTDATFNSVINKYETILFLNNKPNEPVALPKTELHGTGYSNQILLDGISIDLPRPFVFSLSPRPSHPQYETERKNLEQNIILYDNAGEHFEPGRESSNNLATLHLAYSDGIMFLYDPLRDVRMQSICSKNDPQFLQVSSNQLSLFYEMAERIRKFTGMQIQEKYEQPLIMVIAKFDAIKDSLDFSISNDDFLCYNEETFEYTLDLGKITEISFLLREKLLEIAPELVGAAESFSKYVYFVPVSAFGRAPDHIEQSGQTDQKLLGICPKDISPIWAEVPFLLQLHLHGKLAASLQEPEGIEEISQYKFVQDFVLFSIPGERKRYELPRNYWGKYIYSTKNQKYYRVPGKESESTQPVASNSSSVVLEDEFWNN